MKILRHKDDVHCSWLDRESTKHCSPRQVLVNIGLAIQNLFLRFRIAIAEYRILRLQRRIRLMLGEPGNDPLPVGLHSLRIIRVSAERVGSEPEFSEHDDTTDANSHNTYNTVPLNNLEPYFPCHGIPMRGGRFLPDNWQEIERAALLGKADCTEEKPSTN